MNKEEKIRKAILTLEVLIDCTKEDGTYYNAKEEWEALDVFKDLAQENKELHNKIDKAIEITYKILMNNADNRMICNKEEEEYFDWLDKEMLEQEKILKGDVDE